MDGLERTSNDYWEEASKRFKLYAHDLERPIVSPDKLLMKRDVFFKSISNYENLKQKNKLALNKPLNIGIDRSDDVPLRRLKDFIGNKNNCKILICSESLGRRESLSEILVESGINFNLVDSWENFQSSSSSVSLTVSPFHDGFISESSILITENEIYPNYIRQSKKISKNKNFNADGILKDLSELTLGDPVVHEQHGVGRYQGLINIDLGDGETEFLLLHYAEEHKLYIPVSQLHLISRYSGGPIESAPTNRLGSGAWEKSKRKALLQIHDTAVELLNLYSKRSLKKGFVSKISLDDYESFVEGFPFEETPDQLQAIESVIKDMESQRPMDRLVCGDVGFGKTEVALRAAFISVMNNKQVAVLVPTTLLAEQHYNNFLDRFAKWPIKIEEVSRFKSKKQQKVALANLEEGKVDIIIGTHRLLQNDIRFKDLGLVVIDEEHRFGVRQKENLKSLRLNVDVLTLTATPIPRT